LIQIRKAVYNKLIELTKPEECGFLFSIDNIIEEMKIVKNIARNNKENFKIGFIPKMAAVTKVVVGGYDDLIIFHVHSKQRMLSEKDIKYAVNGFYYLIICKSKLYFYRVDKVAGFTPTFVEHSFTIVE